MKEDALIAALSGGPWNRKLDDLVTYAQAAGQLGKPNISGDSGFLVGGVPLQNTPLSLLVQKYMRTKDIIERQTICREMASLIKTGASLYASLSVAQYFQKGTEIALDHMHSIFSLIISYEMDTNVYEAISSKHLTENLSKLVSGLTHLNFSGGMFKKNTGKLIWCLTTVADITALATEPTFFRLLSNLLLSSLDAVKEEREEVISKLSSLLGKSNDERVVTFLNCLRNQDLYQWIRTYPDHVEWDEVETYLQTLPTDLMRQKLLWFADQGLSARLIRLKTIDIKGHGTSETWRKFARPVVVGGDVFVKHPPPLSQTSPVEARSIDRLLSDPHLKHQAFLGRTWILAQGEGRPHLAIKFQKQQEAADELVKEYETVKRLNTDKDELQLESQLPTPRCMGSVSPETLRDLITQFSPEEGDKKALLLSMIPQSDPIQFYAYEAPPSYFTYLHDPTLTNAEFNAASQACFHDLATLLKQRAMVYHQLADIFHNSTSLKERTDNGRYLVLSPFIRRFYEVGNTGRLDQWQKAVQYVNMRASGLADLGDYQFFEPYCLSSIFQEITQPFSQTASHEGDQELLPKDEHAPNLIYANILAEYLLVFTLVCGTRGKALAQQVSTEEEKQEIWLGLANQLLENAALLVHELQGIPKAEAKRYLASAFDPKVCAKQMQFWMGSDYSSVLLNRTITQATLQDLYPGAHIDVEDLNFKNLKPSIGFSNSPPEQDLGDYNCQNPMKEDNKLYYYVALLTFMLRDSAKGYREAALAYEEKVKARDYQGASEAIAQLKKYKYPHSQWQAHHIQRCQTSLVASVMIANRSQKNKRMQLQKEFQAHQAQFNILLGKLEEFSSDGSHSSDHTVLSYRYPVQRLKNDLSKIGQNFFTDIHTRDQETLKQSFKAFETRCNDLYLRAGKTFKPNTDVWHHVKRILTGFLGIVIAIAATLLTLGIATYHVAKNESLRKKFVDTFFKSDSVQGARDIRTQYAVKQTLFGDGTLTNKGLVNEIGETVRSSISL